MNPRLCAFVATLLTTLCLGQTSAFDRDPWPEVKEGPVKVYLLAGQSNMQGHASLRTLEYLIYNEETAHDHQHWKDRRGAWNERRDVWIWTSDGERSGYLKPGFGADEWKLGPELSFGWAMGEHHEEQVLLIKTCWGGRSVRKDFLPPSAAPPSQEVLERDLERLRKRRPETTLEDAEAVYGKAYRDMVNQAQHILKTPSKIFPQCTKGRPLELAGFVWFQGWNDMVDGEQRKEHYRSYTTRLGTLIQDLRRDLNAPNLPVVIGQLGASDQQAFHAAQAAVANLPTVGQNVTYVTTRRFWDPPLEELVRDGVWKGADWVRFYNHGSDRSYHYLGSAKILHQIGTALARPLQP